MAGRDPGLRLRSSGISQLTMGGNPVPVNIGSNGIRVDSDGATEHRK